MSDKPTTQKIYLFLFIGLFLLTSKVALAAGGTFGGGDGSPEGMGAGPYIIEDCDDLQAMSGDLAAHYKLVPLGGGGDIDCSATATWNEDLPDNPGTYFGFEPIGGFSGNFDGNEKTITGLSINRPGGQQIGLFGSNSGTISNVALIAVDITASGNSGNIGSLAGINFQGSITNCSSSGTVSGGTAGSFAVGGLVGQNGGITEIQTIGAITNSFATVNVSGTNSVGGLVGATFGGSFISNSYATGNVIGSGFFSGGLVGSSFFEGIIENSFATGSVTAVGDGFAPGGLVGCACANDSNAVTNSYCSGLDPCVGTGGGSATFETGGASAFFDITHDVYDTNLPVWDFVTTLIWAEVAGSYPILAWQVPPPPDADGDGVADADDLCAGTLSSELPVDDFGCSLSGSQCPSGAESCADFAIIEYDSDGVPINTSGDVTVVGNDITVQVDSITEGTPDAQTLTFHIPDQDPDFGSLNIIIEDSGSTSGTGFVGAFTAVGLTNAIIIGPAGTSFSPPATICITFADSGFCCSTITPPPLMTPSSSEKMEMILARLWAIMFLLTKSSIRPVWITLT